METDHVEHLGDLAADLQFVAPAGGPEHEVQVHKDVAVRQQAVVLKHDAHAAAQIGHVLAPDPAQVETDDAAVPFPQRQLGVQRFQKRTLARSDPADQIDHFARVDRQVHVGKDQVLHAFVSFE